MPDGQREEFLKQATAATAKAFLNEPYFQGLMDTGIKITHINKPNGTVEFEFKVSKSHLNAYGTMHGGFIASMIDWAGSIAIMNYTDFKSIGVSTDISITYNRSAKLDDSVKVVAVCTKVGVNMGFTKVEMFVDGKTVAFGSHTKYLNIKPKL